MAEKVDVRVLLWSGSLVFQPRSVVARRGLKHMREANPRLNGRVDKHVRFSHCHHQKTIVVDGTIAFVGGLDMTDFDIDRWDTSDHPVRDGLNWHDLCLRLEGDAASDVGRNFVQRWNAVTGENISLPAAEIRDQTAHCAPVQIVRTIPAKLYPFAPDGEFGIAWTYQQAIRNARRFIYLENQYLWSPAVVNELIDALKRVEDPEFRIVLVLPARPNIGKRDTDLHVRALREADGGRGRVHVFSLYTAAPDEKRAWVYKPIYVHAKVGIVDDRWCTVGSANLNERGLEGDSELNAQVIDDELAREARLRLWAEHLRLPIETIASLSPSEAIDRLWVPLASHARAVIDKRDGALKTSVVRYELGAMPGDLSLGELEARLLDA
jgi:phosphatidylserine/phosphatidylglycerophosphate/cardiolipin synthase-like enzyme